jgi:hypothetical protein
MIIGDLSSLVIDAFKLLARKIFNLVAPKKEASDFDELVVGILILIVIVTIGAMIVRRFI